MQALKDEVEYLRNERTLLRKDLQEAAETVRPLNELDHPNCTLLFVGWKVQRNKPLPLFPSLSVSLCLGLSSAVKSLSELTPFYEGGAEAATECRLDGPKC